MQCAKSILSGLLLLIAVGSILGSIAGWKATKTVAEQADATVEFDTSFSNSVVDNKQNKADFAEPDIALALITGSGLILTAFFISSVYMKENLKKEPLQLLGRIEER